MTNIKSSQQIRPLIQIRFAFIALQLIAIMVSQLWLKSSLPFNYLYAIVVVETAINATFFYIYRINRNVGSNAYFMQVLMDIIFLTALLYFGGGAANPFVSLLLIPIAISSVTLPKPQLLIITLTAMSSYIGLLITLNPHDLHHMDMQQHLLGMWINFLLSAFVVVLVITSLIRAVNKQEDIVNTQREKQLRQEQLLSLGAAAAQFAHRLATPLSTAALVSEEIKETESYDPTLIEQLEQQLSVCRQHLNDFRTMAEQVKNNAKQIIPIEKFIDDLHDEVQLNFPTTKVDWQLANTESLHLAVEPILIPAFLNLIQNAVIANHNPLNSSKHVEIRLSFIEQHQQMIISIRDHGPGFANDTLLQLGSELVNSKYGLGMGVFLSHVTFNKLHGQLKLYNHESGGAVAEVILPVVHKPQSDTLKSDIHKNES